MARLGRGRPVRGVTILGPGPAYAPTPDPPVAAFVSARRDLPPARRDVPRRAVQVLGPKIIGDPILVPDPVGRIVRPLRQTPVRVATRFFPQPTINRMEAPAVCYLEFLIEERAPLVFELESPPVTAGLREPLVFTLYSCRNEA